VKLFELERAPGQKTLGDFVGSVKGKPSTMDLSLDTWVLTWASTSYPISLAIETHASLPV
jgi:hypothetical protein